ncbi:MAG TPA: hypothetical protein VK066_24555 [Chloroflexota bacterium]|nr:hypothetical protein [Chloroflexota bacterium]
MRQWIAGGSLALLLALAPVGAGAQSPHTVQQWSGNGVQQTTDPFSVASADWTLTWTAQDRDSIPGYLSIAIFNADTRLPAGSVSGSVGSPNGTVTEHNGPGRFYLVIDGANTNWSVQVSDLR